MNNPSPLACEEILDRHQSIFALTMFCVGLALGSSALRELVSSENSLYGVLSVLRAGGGIAGALLVVYFLWQKVSNWRFSSMQGQFLEGFVQHASLRAMAISWIFTLVALSLMTELIDSGYVLPTDFYTKLAIAILLWSFSLSYFLLTRVPAEDGDA